MSLELATRVLGYVGPGVEAEVFVGHTALALTRFANSFIHQNVADATTAVRLRLHADGRTATGSTTVTTDEGLRGLVARTLAAARLLPPDPGWSGLAPPAPLAGEGNWDEATAQAAPDARADQVRAFVDAAGGLETAGYCRTLHWSGAFANSAGQAISGHTAEVAMDGIARLDGADGVARMATGRLSEVDGAVLGARAAAKARASAGAVELPPGRYEVVLEAPAVADLLGNFALYGFNGKAYNERQSFAEPGAEQFDAAVTLVDDTLGVTGIGLPFDAEGTPKSRVTLVDAGVTAALAHDRRTAAEAGARSTGHAVPGGGAFGALPTAVRLEPVAAGAEAAAGAVVDPAAAALVAGVERGLLVTDLWYTRVLDPKSLVVTGLTRNGVWLIEDGEITTPVRNFRFTQSYPQALAPGAVLGVGARTTTLPDSWGMSWCTTPALRLASWNFTGGASG
ncbi:TldD/PmbA family protein [Phytohabitans rumicis]|uniref:Peptidase U62 n=1 Tax=Phytohabitans rumicis TaxID=1076125 RepID=A0A6V8L248_9ACTN|nr:metallopeptidase TldD-related protein [Phytohabitans rumicis]GFJ91362.1 peptidase U62 [Phytohabitans rumicis]